MNQPYLIKQKLIAALLLITAFVIYSCRKDVNSDSEQPHADAIAQARAWYQQTYPLKISTGNLKNMDMSTLAESTKGDFSQLIKPDWNQADTYQRLGKEVIEMPLDSAVKLGFAPETAGEFNFNKAYSHSSFLILKDAKGYQAYIMTIMADTAWVGTDFKKLNNLNYRNRGNAFSGKLLYFTPKGVLTSGYTYKNGKVTGNITGSPVTNPFQKQQAKTANGKKTAETSCTSATVRVYVGMACVQDTQTEIIYCVKFYDIYRMTTCYEMSDQPLGTGDSGWTPPSSGGTTTEEVIDQEEEIEVVKIITNNVNDSCIHRMVDAAINRNIIFNLKQSMNSIFNSNTDFNINFEDGVMHNANGSINYTTDGTTTTTRNNGTFVNGRYVVQALDLTIKLNSSTLPNATEEYITATILHEVLHAYFRATGTIDDHNVMIQNYIPWFKASLKAIYPSIDDAFNEGLAYGGLMNDSAFTNTLNAGQQSWFTTINTNYKNGTWGQKCHP